MSCMPRQHRFGSQVASAETPSEISRTRTVVHTLDSQTDERTGRVPGRHNWTQTRMRRRSERRRAFAKLAEAPFRPHSMRSCLRNHTQKLPGLRSGCVIRLSANARSESSLYGSCNHEPLSHSAMQWQERAGGGHQSI